MQKVLTQSEQSFVTRSFKQLSSPVICVEIKDEAELF